MRTRIVWVGLVLVLVGAGRAVAGTSFEVYTDRAVFEARLGGAGAVRVVDFDDVDTAVTDPAAFGSVRYRGARGATILGADGQFASRGFGVPLTLPPVSAPNVYRASYNETTVYFWAGFEMTHVAGAGVTFVGTDYPPGGPSHLHVRNGNGSIHFDTGVVSGSGPHLFRGIVAIDDQTNEPTPAIFELGIFAGPGYPETAGEHALDDLVFATPQSAALGEVCDNYVDDDGDYAIDRTDGECDRPADGGELGLGDPALAKRMAKCQKTTAKGGAGFVSAVQKQLHGCADAVLQCLEVKPGDAACLPKAVAKCGKASAKIDALGVKLGAAMGKSCGSLSEVASFSLQGLGYSAEYVECLRYGVTLQTGSDIGECIVRQHRCRAQELVAGENARAIELAKLGQLDVATGFACLEPGADGNQTGLGDAARGKAVVKCQKAIAKAGIALAAKAQKLIGKCYDLQSACLQLAPGDPGCREKASTKCFGLFGPVWWGAWEPKSLPGRVYAAIAKGCGGVPLDDLLAPEGLGRGALATACQQLDVPMLGSAEDVAACLIAHHYRRVDRLIENQYPRSQELLWIFD